MMTRARALGVVTATVLLTTLLLAASRSPAEDDRRRLNSLVQELRDRRSDLRQVRKDEREATRALSELDATRYKAQRELERMDQAVARQEKEVEALRGKVTVDVDSVDAMKRRVRSRLRVLSRLGGHSYLRVLLSSASLDELAIRRALLRRITARDTAMLRALQQGEAELATDRRVLEQQLEVLKESRDQTKAALEELLVTRDERGQALLELGAQRGVLETRVESLRQSERELRDLIWSKTAPSRPAVGLAALRGKLPWPLAVQADDNARGAAHANGWTFRAALGTRVRAIADGSVVHAGFLRGYGLLVIVDHGHGYHTLFAHLSRSAVEPGTSVAAGDVVGYVGDSESLDGAKLYFELRSGGRPVKLTRWLSKSPSAP